jgi:multidrug efflux pump subunit AcrA (membrane-fusion protein)
MKRIIIVFCSLSVLLTGCSGGGKTDFTAPPVKTLSQPAQMVSGNINVNGILLPAQQVHLSFGTSGPIELISVRVGEKIQNGQELARLESTLTVKEQSSAALQEIADASRILEEARSRLYYFSTPASLKGLETLAALKQANEDLIQARGAYDSCNDASSQSGDCKNKRNELESAQSAYNTMLRRIDYEASLFSAEARLTKAEDEYERLNSNSENSSAPMEEMIITAPFDGVVAAIHFNQNEWVNPGAGVIELQDISHWKIETKNVSELEIGRIAIGQEVQATVNAFRSETLNGRVVEIHPDGVVQQGDVTYTLIIELDATALNLRPGMTVQVVIVTE